MPDMAPLLIPRVIDGGSANLDALGIAYVAVAIFYTLVVSAELYLLYRHRSSFCVRIRNIRVVFAAVSLLHIYLILVLLVYPWNGLFPCEAEFWIMALFLPTGMACFQACNARVLMAYESQRRLRRNFLEGARKQKVMFTPRGLWDAWRRLSATAKVYVWTVIVLVVSVIPSTVLFFGSKRFHRSYGSFGTHVDSVQCRRGVEWIPSILLQIFWIAVIGPWILWRIRKVHDVHSWAWQTRLAIIAGLPGTPLWLAFTYSNIPAMLEINKYFPPAGWFLFPLVVCQQTLLLIPLHEATKHSKNAHRPDSLTSSTHLETSTLSSKSSTTSSSYAKSPFHTLSPTSDTKHMPPKEIRPKASMQALEFSIEHSIEPLIAWAAQREFTAENTIFLREVRNWKKKWSSSSSSSSNNPNPNPNRDTPTPQDQISRSSAGPPTHPHPHTPAQRRQMFTEASLIFFSLVNPFTAETPINIEYKIFRTLQSIFSVVEFDPYQPPSSPGQNSSKKSSRSEREKNKMDTCPNSHLQQQQQQQQQVPKDNVVCPWEDVFAERPTSIDSEGSAGSSMTVRDVVPPEFDEAVFDAAFESIKYLVFTNTWPRFVEAEGQLQGKRGRRGSGRSASP